MILLNVSHWRQRRPADCLAACSAMVLQYLQVPFQYEQLVNLFETQYFGASFTQLAKLERLGLFVNMSEWGGIADIEKHLQIGLPVLTSVNTRELTSYWNREASHVVLVIGLDEKVVLVNDPAFDDAPKHIPLDEFLLAWDEQYQRYGAVGLDSFE